MSASFHWRPAVVTPPPSGWFDIGLADMLARWLLDDYGTASVDRDGTLRGLTVRKDSAIYHWLQGVRDCAIGIPVLDQIRADASSLIAGIDEHEQIELDVVR